MNKKLLAALTCSTLFMGMTACESNDIASTAEKSTQESSKKSNDTQKKETKEEVPVKEINTTINAGPYKYSPNGTNNEHFIIYDNAKFEDNFDGLKVSMNQLSLTNKEGIFNEKDLGSLRIAFSVENTSSSTFTLNFNDVRVTTDRIKLFAPYKAIKQNLISNLFVIMKYGYLE
ncbi:hypothetical protein OB967_23070 [Bacillus cereus]|nr:hypothetical protein [Bacillus cereus]